MEDTALPAAPPRSRVEEYASWRASFRALGSPEDTRGEREMSDGALRVAVRAYERELAWAPPYVAKDAGGTSRAAEDARCDAALLGLRAGVENDQAERDRLTQAAVAAQERADALERQAAGLLEAGRIRSEWFLGTLETKHHAERAREELAARGIDAAAPDGRVTAREWLATHHDDLVAEDPHRVITDGDVDDTTAVAHDTDNIRETSPDGTEMVPEMPLPDIRERVEDATPVVANTEDWTRVPDMDTTRDALEVAARALNEMEQRRAWEADREAEDHYEIAGQWQAADQIRADSDSYANVLE